MVNVNELECLKKMDENFRQVVGLAKEQHDLAMKYQTALIRIRDGADGAADIAREALS